MPSATFDAAKSRNKYATLCGGVQTSGHSHPPALQLLVFGAWFAANFVVVDIDAFAKCRGEYETHGQHANNHAAAARQRIVAMFGLYGLKRPFAFFIAVS